MYILFSCFAKDEIGATAIEYGMLAALLAVVLIPVVLSLGVSLDNSVQGISACLNDLPGCPDSDP